MAVVRFGILGSLQVTSDRGPVALGGLRERVILGVLLVDSGRLVPVHRLVDAVWEECPPTTAVKQVRNAVSRLRLVMAGHGVPGAVVAEGVGYRLAVADDHVDARVFEARVTAAKRAGQAGRPGEAVEVLRSALALWRGPLLAGLSGRVVEVTATAWEEQRRSAQDACYEHMLALGRQQEIVAELSAVVADDPLAERPAGQLMRALYGCGRQADALQVYHDSRAALAEQLGLDPGPDLQRLYQQILTRDPALETQLHGNADWPAQVGRGRTAPPGPGHPTATGDQDVTPALAVPARVPRQLPAATRAFVGRGDELQQLDGLLEPVTGAPEPGESGQGPGNAVVAAIGGAAGVGKTTLAVHWAHRAANRFPGGQLYVNLRGFDPSGQPAQPAEAIRAFLDALGVSAERIPAGLDAQAALYRTLLADRQILIVLDNARDAAQVRPLLPGSPSCLVLVTSRRQLTSLAATEGAHQLTLGLLSTTEARDLLARHLSPAKVTAETEAADDLIQLCAWLPLALSITAARAAARSELPLASLATELCDTRARLDTLSTGDATTDVRAVFSWSYDSLTTPTARMFALLSLHPGPDISTAVAASLASAPMDEARACIVELTRAHLLTEHRAGRYALHDLLRAYATEHACNLGEQAEREAMRRTLDHYLYAAHAANACVNPGRPSPALTPPGCGVLLETFGHEMEAIAWFKAEYLVLLAVTARAADMGFHTHACQLPAVLSAFLERQGHWHDWAATWRISLAAAERLGDMSSQADAHHGISRACSHLGSYDEARTHAQRAAELFRQAGDPVGQASAQLSMGEAFARQQLYRDALDHCGQAVKLFHAAGHRVGEAVALNDVGWCHAMLGQHPQAIECSRQALAMHVDLASHTDEAAALDTLGYAYHHLGRHDDALTAFRKALALCQEGGNRYIESEILVHLGDTHQAAGDTQAARVAWQQALAILEELHHPDASRVTTKLNQLPGVGLAITPPSDPGGLLVDAVGDLPGTRRGQTGDA